MHKPVTFGLVLVLAAVAACGDSKSDSSTFGNTANGTAGRAVGHTYTINHSNQRGTTLFKNTAVTNACW